MSSIYTIIDFCEQSEVFCLYDAISGRSEWVYAKGIIEASGTPYVREICKDFLNKKVDTFLINSFKLAVNPVFIKE